VEKHSTVTAALPELRVVGDVANLLGSSSLTSMRDRRLHERELFSGIIEPETSSKKTKFEAASSRGGGVALQADPHQTVLRFPGAGPTSACTAKGASPSARHSCMGSS